MSTAANKRKEVPPQPPATRHDDDLYTWVREQIALLRAGRLSDIDALNIAEELSDVGESSWTSWRVLIRRADHAPAQMGSSGGTVGLGVGRSR